MKKYLKTDEWNIIEDSFQADRMRWSESIFSLGNGRFGQRGHFEEPYSSDSYRGAFVAGITFLDKTRVGWWKNGFPQFYTRIPNAPDWSSISLRLIDEELDLAQWDVDSFNRRLDMKAGISYRDAEVTSPRGNKLRLHVEHIANNKRRHLGLIAQEVQEALADEGIPESDFAALCTEPPGEERPDGLYTLRYGEIQIMAIAKIQQMAEEIAKLKEQVAALSAGKE